MVFLHELLAVLRLEDSPETPQRLGDEERGAFAGIVQSRGVELDELHVFNHGLGPVRHGDAVARRHPRIGRHVIDIPHAAGGDDRHPGKNGLDTPPLQVHHVGTVTLDTFRMPRHELPQMMLREQIYGEMIFEHFDVAVALDLRDERPFDFGPRLVLVMQNTVLRMPPFAGELVSPLPGFVEPRPPLHEVLHQLRSARHDQLHRLHVADTPAAHHRIVYVLLERVRLVGHAADAPLRIVRIAFVHLPFGDDNHMGVLRRLQGEAQAGSTTAYHQIIRFEVHRMPKFYVVNPYCETINGKQRGKITKLPTIIAPHPS